MAKKVRAGAIRLDGSVAIPLEHDALGHPSCGRIPFLRDGKWGFVDYEGQVRVEPVYDFVWAYRGDAAAVERDGTWSSIGLDGEAVEGFRGPWSEDRAATVIGGAPTRESLEVHHQPTGYVDRSGELVIDASFTRARPFRHGLATVQRIQEGAHGPFEALDAKGETVVGPLAAWDAGDFREDGWCRFKSDHMCFYDRKGQLALDTGQQQARDFHEDLAAYQTTKAGPGYTDTVWGFLDREGTVVIEAAWGSVGDFSDGLAIVTQSGKAGAIDREGTQVIAGLRYLHPFHRGGAPAAVQHPQHFSSNVWGLIGTDGEWRLPAEYARVVGFGDGVGLAKKEDLTILMVDVAGAIVAEGFTGAKVGAEWPRPMTKSGKHTKTGKLSRAKWGLYDREGNVVVKEAYKDMWLPVDGIVRVSK